MVDRELEEIRSYGHDAGHGNLVGMEPCLTTADYATVDAFRARLDGYMQVARRQGWITDRTIVVWPEHIGTWLAVAGEGERAWAALTLKAAMRAVVLRHLLPFVRAYLLARERDRAVAALFRVKARAMARAYQSTFSGLAREYRVTMVAGSTVLPAPRVADGQVVAGRGALHGTLAVFGPDGRALAPLVLKAFPTSQELPFVAPAPVGALPAFGTPAGRLGVLICADAWYPAAYARLRGLGVDWLAVPSAVDLVVWDQPWRGYDGAAPPPDVDLRDVGMLSEGQAWRKYALAGRLAQSGARCGINVFSRGELWDMAAQGGQATLVHGDTVVQGRAQGAAILNLWLP